MAVRRSKRLVSAARRRTHWNRIYRLRGEGDLSWHQDQPGLSLALIRSVVPRPKRILDVGGGSSVLAGRLLAAGYRDVSVVDVSETALRRARRRIGRSGGRVHWQVADVLSAGLLPEVDLWHDRAVFHFLTRARDRGRYRSLAATSVRRGGHLVLSTFAPDGPTTCSGLRVRRWDAAGLAHEFAPYFVLERTEGEDHVTPWGVVQPFTYVRLRRSARLAPRTRGAVVARPRRARAATRS